MKPRLVVIGSANMDLVVRSAHIPAPGETVLGEAFRQIVTDMVSSVSALGPIFPPSPL